MLAAKLAAQGMDPDEILGSNEEDKSESSGEEVPEKSDALEDAAGSELATKKPEEGQSKPHSERPLPTDGQAPVEQKSAPATQATDDKAPVQGS